MKINILKFLFLFLGIIGLLASIFNIYIERTLNGNFAGLISAIFFIMIAINIKTIISKFGLNFNWIHWVALPKLLNYWMNTNENKQILNNYSIYSYNYGNFFLWFDRLFIWL